MNNMCSQISFNISSSGFNERRDCSLIRTRNDLVTNIIRENVLVFGEGIDGFQVKVQKIRRPGRRSTIDRAIDRESQVDTIRPLDATLRITKVRSVHGINPCIIESVHAVVMVQ